MGVLLVAHPDTLEHHAGDGHPERPARLVAVLDGIRRAGLDAALAPVEARPATRAELEAVHDPASVDRVEAACAWGPRALDPDTIVAPGSWRAALLAAGAGPAAVEALDGGRGDAAFVAVRPPGHHATPERSMGFCLLNNVAVTAAALAARGERVLVVDWDAHHGNGTQAAFEDDPRVAYASIHQSPLYPGTGAASERGGAAGAGTTVNVPVPPGATGDIYRRALDSVIRPFAEAFAPTWLLVSAGFDLHRADPLTDLGCTDGDVADLAADVLALAPAGRRIAFLEGGYDLEALGLCAAATVAAMAGVRHASERPTAGGPGREVVDAVAADVARRPPGGASP